MYDKKTLEKKSREKNRERLGILDEDEIYYSHTNQKELEELKNCTFKPLIHKKSNSKGRDHNTTDRRESQDEMFNRLHEVDNFCIILN